MMRGTMRSSRLLGLLLVLPRRPRALAAELAGCATAVALVTMEKSLRSSLVIVCVLVSACRSEASKREADDPAPEPSAAITGSTTPVPPDAGLPDYEQITFPTNGHTLGGFLYRPKGPGPFPAVVFNHGSEKDPENKMGQAMFFVNHGYVLLVPHRRGHGVSPGEYIVDASDRGGEQALVEGLEQQVDDVEAAVTFVKTLPYVDSQRLFMSGCSFGGIMTALASERQMGVRAGADFAGAAITWATSPLLQQRMITAVRGATFPLFFVQAENDYDTTPSKVLATEMEKLGKAHKLKIFPPNGTTPAEGHGFCTGGRAPGWGDEVLAFFDAGAAP